MMKSKIALLFLLILLFSCKKNDNRLVIEGELSNLETSYILASFQVSDSIRVDTIYVDNKGKFSFTQNVDTATIFTLYFNDFNSSTIIFSDKGINKIKIKGDANLSDLIEIRGGEVNDNLSDFKKENETLLKQRTLLLKKVTYENDSLTNSLSLISEKEETATLNSINHELAQNVEEYIMANPTKASSVVLINEFFKSNENPETLNRVLGYLEGEALNLPLTYKLKHYNQKIKLSAEGAQMPYFKLKINEEEYLKSTDFKNKYLLLSFVSSHGDESRENIKNLNDIYTSLDTTDFKFLSVFVDSDTFPIKNPLLDTIPWNIVIENKSWGADIVEKYNINYLPFNILIDPEGKIATRDIPASDIKDMIKNKNQ